MNKPLPLCLILPSLNPTAELETLCSQIVPHFQQVILVNDGSHAGCNSIFTRASQHPNLHLIVHPTNLGKGAAIKSALLWLMAQECKVLGALTADSDGQHLPADIMALAKCFLEAPDSIWIGQRVGLEQAPIKSRIGHKIAGFFFRLAWMTELTDSQSGLRALPSKTFSKLTQLPHQRYDWELAVLFLCKRHAWEIKFIPIKTHYIDNNKASHFRPIADGIKIGMVFFQDYFMAKRI